MTLDQVYKKLVEVISSYVPLTGQGAEYRGQCPFCKSDNSLRVSPSKGFFYCDSCGKGGNVLKFVSLIEGVSYADACERLGMTWEDIKNELNREDNKTSPDDILMLIKFYAGDTTLPSDKRLGIIDFLLHGFKRMEYADYLWNEFKQ